METQTSPAARADYPVLGASEAIATIAVKDLTAARLFYEGKLGFELAESRAGSVDTYTNGDSRFFVYVSPSAGTNEATAVTWLVDDVEGVAKALRALGVEFEHYNYPGTTLKGDVHVQGEMKAAWFKDPDGNILAIVSP